MGKRKGKRSRQELEDMLTGGGAATTSTAGDPKGTPGTSKAGAAADPVTTSTQPPRNERGPVKPDYKVGDKLDATVKPDQRRPGGFMATPLVAGKKPSFFILGGQLPPTFDPPGTVEIQITYIKNQGTFAEAEVVGPAELVAATAGEFETCLLESTNHWQEKLVDKEISVPFKLDDKEFDVIRKSGRNDEIAEVTLLAHDEGYLVLPINLRIKNIPKDWRRPDDMKEVTIRITQVESKDGKRVIGQAYALGKDFPQPPTKEELERIEAERAAREAERVAAEAARREKEEKIRKQVAAIDAYITEQGDRAQFNRDQDRKALTRDGKFWVLKDWMIPTVDEGDLSVDMAIEVPEGWNPNLLLYDADGNTEIKMIKGGNRGDRLHVICHFVGFDPKEKLPAVPKAEVGKTSKLLEGSKLLTSLKPLLGTDAFAAISPLLEELDEADLAQAHSLPKRLVLVRKIETIIDDQRDVLAGDKDALKRDEGAVKRLLQLGEELKKIAAEIQRIEREIETARAVLTTERVALTGEEQARKARREAQIAALRLKTKRLPDGSEISLEDAVQARHMETNIEISGIEDIEELRRLLAREREVLAMRDEWLNHGVPPEKDGDPDYQPIEYTEDFWVAEVVIPEYEARIAELERIAAGLPAPVVPPPPPPDTGAPKPVVVTGSGPAVSGPGDPGAPKSASVEARPARPEVSVMQRYDWLLDHGFTENEVVSFLAAAHAELAELFSPDEPLPQKLRIREYRLANNEVDIDAPPAGAIFTISVDHLYSLVRETTDVVQTLSEAGLVSHRAITLDKTAVDALLKERLKSWLEEKAGRVLPNTLTVIRADVARAVIFLEADPTLKLGDIYLPIEEVLALLKDHIKLADVAPLKAADAGALETKQAIPEREIPAALDDVLERQIWRYEGKDSDELKKGGTFVVVKVDYDSGRVLIRTAKEEMLAAREKRQPRLWIIPADKWKKFPKTFVSGPQPEAHQPTPPGTGGPKGPDKPSSPPKAGPAKVEIVAEVAVTVKAGDVFIYSGSRRVIPGKDGGPALTLNPNTKIEVAEVDKRTGKIKFKVEGHPTVLVIDLDNWNKIPKQKPPKSPDREPRSAERPRVVVAEYEPDELPEEVDGEPAGPRTVVSAPWRSEAASEGENPRSMKELVDLVRNRGVVEKVKALVKEKAGLFGGMLSMFDDPVKDTFNRIERVAAESGDVLAINRRLADKARVDMDTSPEGATALGELNEAGRNYRIAEQEALAELNAQFNLFLTGKATLKTADVVKIQVAAVERALGLLKRVNERARAVLEPAPRKPGRPAPKP